MTTNVDVLKDALYEKIAEINDEEILVAIKTLIDNVQTEVLDEAITRKRDLTSYIKEWAKSV